MMMLSSHWFLIYRKPTISPVLMVLLKNDRLNNIYSLILCNKHLVLTFDCGYKCKKLDHSDQYDSD